MPDKIAPATLLEGGGDDHNVERANEAVRRMRRMLPGLNAFARALTRNPLTRVVLTPGTPCTDGVIIHLRPPIELGDKTPHQLHLCNLRDDRQILRCATCRVINDVETTLYHEIAHIVFNSFEALSDTDKAEIIARRMEELGTDDTSRTGKIAATLRAFEASNPGGIGYMGAAQIVSPYLPIILNALEDARVNIGMYRSRPGTYKMFRGQMVSRMEDGIEKPDGTMMYWRDQPENIQMVCGLCARAAGFETDGWFTDEINEALDDPELVKLLDKVRTVRSTKAIYRLGFPVLEAMRRLGYCKRLEDQEDDQQPELENDNIGSKGGDKGQRDDNENATPSGPSCPEDGDPAPKTKSLKAAGDDEALPQEAGENEDGADGTGQESNQDSSGTAAGGTGTEDGSDGLGDEGDDEAGTDGSGDAEGDDEAGTDGSGGLGDEDDDEEAGTGADADEPDDDDDFDTDAERDSGAGGGGSAEGDYQCIECDVDFNIANGGHAYIHAFGGPVCADCYENEFGTDEDDEDGLEAGGNGDSENEQMAGNSGGSGDTEGGDTPEAMQEALDQFGGHHMKPPSPEDLEAQAEVNRAIVQGEYFDQPSRTVYGVNIHREGHDVFYGRKNLSTHLAWMPHNTSNNLVVDEGIISASLGRLRVVFGDNKKARYSRNLRAGRINASALGRRIPVEDDRIFQKKREPGAKDYFVVLALDNSGSTEGRRLAIIKKAALHQAEMLSRLGIKFAMYAHNGSPHQYDPNDLYRHTNLMNLDIVVIKEAAEPWGPRQRARLGNVGAGLYNLDGHALEYYRKVCDQQRATDKVILYYTDGQMPAANFDDELGVLQREIKTCRRLGYSLVGVGVQTDSPKAHGLDTVVIHDERDVPLVVKELESRINRKVSAA